jgi:hypothetical protein
LDVVFGYLISSDLDIPKHSPNLSLQFLIELMVFSFVVPRAPVVQMTVDAVLYLDMHANRLIILLM